MDLQFKEKVYQHGLLVLLDKQANLQKEIAALRDGIANDSKSSMGDKYETSREMSQQEINRLEQQFAINQQHFFNLKNLALQNKYHQILLGSLVVTNIGSFFITVSLGEIKIDNQSVFMISPVSPIGKLLIGKKAGDEFEMNKKMINVLAIF